MAGPRALIPQADISRTIRALKAAGDAVARVIVRPDRSVSIETGNGKLIEVPQSGESEPDRPPLVF